MARWNVSDDFTRFRMTWLDQIYDDCDLTPVARDIAFRISRMFNRKRYTESGTCTAWPSYDTLAKEAGCTSKTVQRAVSLLKIRGHLETTGNGGRHCTLTYFAIVRGGQSRSVDAESKAAKGGHGSPPFAKQKVVEVEKVDISGPKGGHLKPEKVDTSVLQTSLNKISDEISDARDESVQRSPARGPVGVVVLSILAQGPTARFMLPPFLRGKEEQFPDLVLNEQAQNGWPDLSQLCQEPHRRSVGLARLALEMEPVALGSEQWAAWKAEYRSRGWPMPEPLNDLACFPACGPRKLDAFLDRLKLAMIDDAVSVSRNVVRLAAGR
jgi:hypothetical protein